jgi:DNA-directed RNA polymerase subunit RPC12/RpoP
VSQPCNRAATYAILTRIGQEASMKEVRKVHYVKGVFVCPKCRQSYVQEKWIESWRVRCHRCDYRGALTDVSVEERMEEETFRR